jgi:hypothetical protein
MRPQLLFGGLLVGLMGAGFYTLALPFAYFWSVPFGVAGAIMIVASILLPETQGSVQPPEGFRFCPYCATPVPLGATRCPHCDGVQPKEG